VILLAAICIVLMMMAGCGSGGGSDSGGTNPPKFTTEDFSGKSLYSVPGGTYQLATFYPDGTARASDMMTSGTPVLQPEVASWNVVNGELMINTPGTGDIIRYVLLSNDTASRYFRTEKHSSNGIVSVVGMFYDQATGLSQAQDFVANHKTP
jgi:hypothetical protein